MVSRFPEWHLFTRGLTQERLNWDGRPEDLAAVAAEAWHILAAMMPPLIDGGDEGGRTAATHNFGNSLRTSSAWKIIRRPAFCRTA